MKANELMIDDWVLDKKTNRPYKIIGTNDLLFHNDYSPIPLTAEILEKIGFVEFMPHNWQIVIDNIMIEIREPEHNMAIWLDWEEHDTGTYASYILPGSNFVHELQHALQLCEIDKEIEI